MCHYSLESSGSSAGDSDLGEMGDLVDRFAVSLEGSAKDGVLVLCGHLGLSGLGLQLGLRGGNNRTSCILC